MNYYDYEVNGEYNRQRVKAEIDQIRLGDRTLRTSRVNTIRISQIAGALFQRLISIEKSLQHQLSVLLHVHPRPAAIHLRRRR